MRRVAIYGGTFDPVHNGHLEVARQVLKLFELDELIFVPACVPPHKRNANITSAFHRFAMLTRATEADQRLLVSTVELDAPDRPYAVETVARMKKDGERLFYQSAPIRGPRSRLGTSGRSFCKCAISSWSRDLGTKFDPRIPVRLLIFAGWIRGR